MIIDKVPNIKSLSNKKVKFSTFKTHLLKHLRTTYLTYWHNAHTANLNGKLRTYTKFKTNFGCEKYLTILNNFQQRQSLTKFRISCHRLIIERGRYINIPEDLRICSHCNTGEIGNETHFLFNCTKFHTDRQPLIKIIDLVCKDYAKLNSTQKLSWLMNCEHKDILISAARFIYTCCD